MKLSTFLTINAVVGFVFGTVLLLIPGFLLAFNGIHTGETGLAIARLFGAEFIGFNIITWLVRDARDTSSTRLVILGHIVSESLGFVVALAAKLAGLGNNFFWAIVITYLVFAVGYAYFQFARPQPA